MTRPFTTQTTWNGRFMRLRLLLRITKNSAPRKAPSTLPGIASNGKPVQGRCGHGPRLPLLVVSPWARSNFVDHTLTDQSSITRFVEDNWLHGKRIGGGSFDAIAGSLEHMFDFFQPLPARRKLILDEQTGQPQQQPSPWPWASQPHTPHG